MNNGDYLNNHSKDAGVDLNMIREKYENIKHRLSKNNSSNLSNHIRDHDSDLNHRLDNYRICKSCLGKGIIKTIYNHMVLEKECEECQGESIVFSQNKTK